MGFIYQEANAYGVEALVALERHYTPTEEKYCTAVTEAVRICDTYGIPERELVPQVRHIAAAEEYLLEHLSEDEETLQFLFTPLSGSNTCLAWFLVWDYVRPGGEKAYKYTGHTPQQRLRDIISAVGQYQEDPLPPPQQLDTICALIDYMDLTRLPPADRWRLLTLYAHLEEYERTACRIPAGTSDADAGDGPSAAAVSGADTGEHPPSYKRLCPVPDAVRPEHHLSALRHVLQLHALPHRR